MSCCVAGDIAFDRGAAQGAAAMRAELRLASREVGDNLVQTDLAVPDVHCGACMQKIERALGALPGVAHVRVNLSTRRVAIRWRSDAPMPPLLETLERLGYPAHLFDGDADRPDEVLSELIRAVAVAGFSAGNIMLLSVSVWAGAEPGTRDLFHWLSALIALPALVYSGRIFYRSAWRVLRAGHTNMDVPISIGVSLAFAMSLYDTVHHGAHAYFDATVSLLFFLLIGRTLDHMMRERARAAVKNLSRIAARGALVLHPDGRREYVPVAEIAPGMTILLAAGERVPVDARVEAGISDLDCALVSGESAPQPVGPGSMLRAGTLNLTGPLTVVATAAAKDSFLAEMVRLMEAAEAGRSGYRRIADRAARIYSPAVHLAAFLSFLGWYVVGGDWHQAVTIAVAVLIITCPCALGLAVPMVQVMAARRLFENGIMVKDGAAMERLTEVDTAVFDKTGTLTLGDLVLRNADAIPAEHFATAAALALHSRHPHSRAIAAEANRRGLRLVSFDRVVEHPGLGVEAVAGAVSWRLGRAAWALASNERGGAGDAGTVLARDGVALATFTFDDSLRPGAVEAIAALRARGIAVEMISGDAPEPVRQLAERLGIDRYQAGVLPADKTARIAELAAAGRKVLMVGDGLNDAPALVAAHASMAPASAADVGRNAADFVFLRDSLTAVPLALSVSRDAARLIRQNFALAIGYNALALPLAVAGCVTPLVAALAMSTSSILVVANALRLRAPRLGRRQTGGEGAAPNLARLKMEPAE